MPGHAGGRKADPQALSRRVAFDPQTKEVEDLRIGQPDFLPHSPHLKQRSPFPWDDSRLHFASSDGKVSPGSAHLYRRENMNLSRAIRAPSRDMHQQNPAAAFQYRTIFPVRGNTVNGHVAATSEPESFSPSWSCILSLTARPPIHRARRPCPIASLCRIPDSHC